MNRKICAYCKERVATEKEHVFPKCLYTKSKAKSRIQRLTIPACTICNNGWADDEAHFRSVLGLAGDQPNEIRQELWKTKILPGLHQSDGPRRLSDLFHILQPVIINGQQRLKIYPGNDPRVIRVVKKIVRGLCYHHGIQSAITESHIWVDIVKYQIPDEFLSTMNYEHRDPNIAEYRYIFLNDPNIQSAWLITFWKGVTFTGIVFDSEVSKRQLLSH